MTTLRHEIEATRAHSGHHFGYADDGCLHTTNFRHYYFYEICSVRGCLPAPPWFRAGDPKEWLAALDLEPARQPRCVANRM